MFIQSPLNLSGFAGLCIHTPARAGLFALNHSVVFCSPGLEMDVAVPMSFPHCGQRSFAGSMALGMTKMFNAKCQTLKADITTKNPHS